MKTSENPVKELMAMVTDSDVLNILELTVQLKTVTYPFFCLFMHSFTAQMPNIYTSSIIMTQNEQQQVMFYLSLTMTNLDSILKSRDITLPTKVCLVKTMVFPVIMYGGESWTVKKAECQRIDAFNCGVGEDS